MPRVQIIIETPALVRVGLPILTVASYDIEREINAAGPWVLEFPAGEALAAQVRTRWRISIVEEGRPGYLLRRGIVTDRQFNIGRDGGGVLRLAGFTRLFGLARKSTHLGLAFNGDSILAIATFLADDDVIAPTVPDIATRAPSVTFNDTSNLAALITALEYSRLSVRETFDEDGYELVSWDNVPDSGYRFVTVAQAGPELDRAAANGMGLIAGRPRIGYNGREVATRIIPVGVDHDGSPLTLAASTLNAPYQVRTFANPDGSSFYYLEDDAATAAAELIELPLVRSDIKNPSDNPTTRALAATALYAVAAGTLIQRRSDTIAFASEIANGNQIDALPGDRVRVQFRGRAAGFGGASNYWSLDQWFLIVKRRDASAEGGVRGVSFTLTAPEVPLRTPSLPDAIPIPPPPSPPPDPPPPSTSDPTKDKENEDALPLGDTPDVPLGGDVPPMDMPPEIPPGSLPPGGPGRYQPCCPDSNDNDDGDTPPPEDIGPDGQIVGESPQWDSIEMRQGNFHLSGGVGENVCLVLIQVSYDGPEPPITGDGVNIIQAASFDFQSRLYEGNPESGTVGYEHQWISIYVVTRVPNAPTSSLSGNCRWMGTLVANEPLTNGVSASCSPSDVGNLSFVYDQAEEMDLITASGAATDNKSALFAWCNFGSSSLFYDNPWSNGADKISVHHMLGANRGSITGIAGTGQCAIGPVADPTVNCQFWYRGPAGGTGGKWGIGAAVVNVTTR